MKDALFLYYQEILVLPNLKYFIILAMKFYIIQCFLKDISYKKDAFQTIIHKS